jgi:hypothetical protein
LGGRAAQPPTAPMGGGFAPTRGQGLVLFDRLCKSRSIALTLVVFAEIEGAHPMHILCTNHAYAVWPAFVHLCCVNLSAANQAKKNPLRQDRGVSIQMSERLADRDGFYVFVDVGDILFEVVREH